MPPFPHPDESPSPPAPRLVCIGGPTAAGKTAVAMELAARFSGEIVSVDSMQVYRGMDIGTAKPSAKDRRRVPHHLIDVAEVNEPFDAASFVRHTREALRGIHARGRVAILCGGTGFYFKALLEGLGDAPPSDPGLRAVLEATPLPDLLHELEQSDPDLFGKIDRNNPRRVVRALEVIRLTGKPFSQQRADWATPPSVDDPPFFGVMRDPTELRQSIDRRVDEMFARGLVAETQQLLARGLADNPTAMQAIGYRQVVEYLNGVRPLADTVALVKARTRQFAKRQLTWFRRQLRVEWIQWPAGADAAAVAGRIAAAPSAPFSRG